MNINEYDNVLITGITGFLGRHLVKKLNNKCNVIGISHSEARILYFRAIFPDIKIYKGDIVNYELLEKIMIDSKINKIIHCAAMKHVGLCQENPTECVQTNILSSLNLIKLAKKYNVKDFIAVSTDKANNPSCVYGMSKHIMEKMTLEHGYRIFQGVNFFWSDGSVLEFWYKAYKNNKPLGVYSNAIRYFCDINEICDQILTSPKKIITTDINYKISIENLLKGFCKAFDYNNYEINMKDAPCEKHEEDIIAEKYSEPDVDKIAEIIKTTFPDTILYI